DGDDLYAMRVDGTELRKLTDRLGPNRPEHVSCPSWSPDGKQIAVVYETAVSNDLGILNLADGKIRQLYRGSVRDLLARVSFPVWSPDGKTIAFAMSGMIMAVAPDGSNSRTLFRASAPT